MRVRSVTRKPRQCPMRRSGEHLFTSLIQNGRVRVWARPLRSWGPERWLILGPVPPEEGEPAEVATVALARARKAEAEVGRLAAERLRPGKVEGRDALEQRGGGALR